MIRARAAQAVLCIALAFGWAACDRNDAQSQFEADALLPPSGITQTDENGNVLGDPDPDDWRTAPAFPSVAVDPAFPNPVPVGFAGAVQITIHTPFPSVVSGGLQLLIYDPRPPHRPATLIDQISPGSIFHVNTLSFTRADVQAALNLADPAGLYRLYIQDGTNRLISYGDVRAH